jgi:signal transduction histidine kinase
LPSDGGQQTMWYLISFLGGAAVVIPLIFWVARRTEARVRRLEKRARAVERLAELGTLTSGLAHEIKNPLSTIGLNLQLLAESIDDSDLPAEQSTRLCNRIDSVRMEGDRLRTILEDFLSFAGRVRLETASQPINEIVDQLADFYSPQAEASGIQLRTQLDPAAGKALVDPTLLKQALLNLLINGTQAMVDARYGQAPHGGSQDLILRTQPADDGVIIQVTDTGPGIKPEALQQIFRPYFTTKRGGTGLGLATTRRIVNEHGGTISAHSDIGRGTEFTIVLPRGVVGG